MRYVCDVCGKAFKYKAFRCPACKSWYSTKADEFDEKSAPTFAVRKLCQVFPGSDDKRLISITDIAPVVEPRVSSGMKEVDRVLGGGFVRGTVSLLGGAPGSGKSTLSLQIGSAIARLGGGMIYLSGEESQTQARIRAERVGAVLPGLMLLCQTELHAALEQIGQYRPALLVVDSIQTLHCADISSSPGSQAQLRESASCLIAYARQSGTPVLVIGHVTKSNTLAGPRLLEHMVDTVLYLEGNREETNCRVLRASKGRYADTSEVGIFRMRDDGLQPVADPTTVFLPQGAPAPGSVLTVVMEGERGLLVEVQALVGAERKGQGRRSIVGLDASRVQLVEAVLGYHGFDVSQHDVFLSVAGGYQLQVPEADLAIALAILSSFHKRECIKGQRVVAFGELSLDGSIRVSPGAERRVKAAERHGYSHIWSAGSVGSLGLVHVADVLRTVRGAICGSG